MEEKECPICHEVKPVEEGFGSRQKPEGLRANSWCRKCRGKRQSKARIDTEREKEVRREQAKELERRHGLHIPLPPAKPIILKGTDMSKSTFVQGIPWEARKLAVERFEPELPCDPAEVAEDKPRMESYINPGVHFSEVAFMDAESLQDIIHEKGAELMQAAMSTPEQNERLKKFCREKVDDFLLDAQLKKLSKDEKDKERAELRKLYHKKRPNDTSWDKRSINFIRQRLGI